MRFLSTLLVLICLLSVTEVAAQPYVTVSGVVVKPLTTPPCPSPTGLLELEHTGVYLTATAISLTPFIGQTVQVTGPLISTGSCTLIDVHQIGKAPYILETCGGGALGCPVRIKIFTPGSGFYGLFTSLGTGFVPGSVTGGTFLLDPVAHFLLFATPETGSVIQHDFTIPVDPALQVLTFNLQAVRVGPPMSGVLQMSTLDTIWTGTFTTPCHIPQC